MAETPRVVVGVSGSSRNLAALHRGVLEARRRDALLIPLMAWTPPGGELAYHRFPCPPMIVEWERAAAKRLGTAFERVGGYPCDVRIRPLVVRGEAGPALVATADQPDDLLVVGAGRRGRIGRLFHGSVPRCCLAHARCAVVAVPPSELPWTLEGAARSGTPTTLPGSAPRTSVGH